MCFACFIKEILRIHGISTCIEASPDKIKAIMEIKSPKTVKEVQSLTGKVATPNIFVFRATDKRLPFFKVLKKVFQ